MEWSGVDRPFSGGLLSLIVVHKRAMVLVLAVLSLGASGCGAGSNGGADAAPSSCPDLGGEIGAGKACTVQQGVWCFSQCDWCQCVDGHFVCGSPWAWADRPCTSAPTRQCSTEGHAGCSGPRPSTVCLCAVDGTWHCVDACYTPNTPYCPPRYVPELESSWVHCYKGAECVYPDRTCRCNGDDPADAGFRCDPTMPP